MKLVARWGVAVAASAAGFALAWWICQEIMRLDEGASLGIAGAVVAIVIAIGAWWAPRETDSGEPGGDGHPAQNPPLPNPPLQKRPAQQRLVQNVRAGRDSYVAGRDLTVNERRQDEGGH